MNRNHLNHSLKIKSILLITSMIFIYACANIVAPSGGPRDEDPPEITQENPLRETTNFTADRITLSFNEFVELNNPTQQVIISPPMEKMPEFRLRGRNLTVIFKDSLRANTTYTINFGSAIRDITEGNVMENYTYVFSTGDYIDSLLIDGYVRDAFTNQPMKDVNIMLYESFADSAVHKKRPYYLARTNESGYYRFDYLQDGEFYLFALKDNNFNLLYDLPDEKIAFLENPVNTTDTTNTTFDLRLFQEKPKRIVQLSSKRLSTHIMMVLYNQIINNVELNSIDSQYDINNLVKTYFNTDTLFIYYTASFDTVKQGIFTINGILNDTIRLVNPENENLSFLNESDRGGIQRQLPPSKSDVQFFLNQPLNQTKIGHNFSAFVEDSLFSPVEITNAEVKDKPWQIEIEANWKAGENHILIIDSGTFTSLTGVSNKLDTIRVRQLKEGDFSTLKLNLNFSDDAQYIMQVYRPERDTEKILFEKTFKAPFSNLITIPHLSAGNVRLRFIKDLNQDGLWTTGDYNNFLHPEKVLQHPGDIQIRANWEVELEISGDNLNQ